MKKIINKEETPHLEILKRILYSFQVLIIGIAIPVLFFLGVSTRNEKKVKDSEVIISSNQVRAAAKSVIELSIGGYSFQLFVNHIPEKKS